MIDSFLYPKLQERRAQQAFRTLHAPFGPIDFCSNDYLGIATHHLLKVDPSAKHGSSGSRLLAGNYPLIEQTESLLAHFHEAPAALIFNSGYDANLGLLSCVPQRGDTILYDQLSHASIRDGIRLSFAQSFSFLHNDVTDLEKKIQSASGNIFVVTETVFSMDGDCCPLRPIIDLCQRYGAHLVVDEAHALGIIGERGEGLAQSLQLQDYCFARVYTFGKAPGCHGAAVVGSNDLKDYLINFSRPFIYTTALPETSVAAIQSAYQVFPGMQQERAQIRKLVEQFSTASLKWVSVYSGTPIQAIIVPGNDPVKKLATHLQGNGFDIRPVLYPTVPKGSERLRIVLHSFNTGEQVARLLSCLNEH